MHIYFIRHGESQANKEGIFAGQTDAALTQLGLSQAQEAGEKLKSLGLKIDMIVSSPLSRAYDTAIEIARAINYPQHKIVLNPLLKERFLGSLEGQAAKDSLLRMMAMNDDELTSEGIETISALMQRAQGVLDNLDGIQGNILLVSHNGLGRGLFAVTHNIAFYDIKKLPNAQILELSKIPLLEDK
jgi:probable phosphoglycerate mutase